MIDYGLPKAFQLLKPILIMHRNLLNEENGYMVFQPSLNPTFMVKKKQISLSHLKSFLIYSDGYYSSRDTFKLYKNHGSFYKAEVNETITKIEFTAYQENNFKQFPRFKIIDNISVIKVII